MNRVSTAIALMFVVLVTTASLQADRPNVVIVITDDQGYGDLGVTGNTVLETPNIDAMAKRSASVSNFYVSPVCAPTRASLMTGRYNYRTRCIDTYIGRAMMDPEEVTVAEVLSESGYATGIFGKWHMGDNYPMRPMDQGFSQSLIHRGGGIGQPSDPPGGEGKYTDAILFENGEQVQTKGYCTDVYFDAAMSFISESKKNDDNFFIYLPTNAPHGPYHDVPQELYEYYKNKNLANDQFDQSKGHKLPKKHKHDQRARIFAMIANVDQNVGRLFKHLAKTGLTDNTIVIFMVDNGPNGMRYVAGHRGMKSHVHEGGIRSPFFVHWPAGLRAGHQVDRVAAHIDIMPTILDACQVSVPKGLKLDGLSLLPLLKGGKPQWPDRTIYIQSHRGDKPTRYAHFAARNQQWKLLHASGFGRETLSGEPKFELYNIAKDPLELKNVIADHPDIFKKMKANYNAWFDDVGSTRPDNYAPPRIHIGTPHENPTVLTRQDWRHTKGRPWAADSHGYWLIYSAESKKYDVRVRFRPTKSAGTIKLAVGGQTLSSSFKAGDTIHMFKGVEIKKGNTKLDCTMTIGDNFMGPWHVDVIQP